MPSNQNVILLCLYTHRMKPPPLSIIGLQSKFRAVIYDVIFAPRLFHVNMTMYRVRRIRYTKRPHPSSVTKSNLSLSTCPAHRRFNKRNKHESSIRHQDINLDSTSAANYLELYWFFFSRRWFWLMAISVQSKPRSPTARCLFLFILLIEDPQNPRNVSFQVTPTTASSILINIHTLNPPGKRAFNLACICRYQKTFLGRLL